MDWGDLHAVVVDASGLFNGDETHREVLVVTYLTGDAKHAVADVVRIELRAAHWPDRAKGDGDWHRSK